jgi:hypothetical protein
MLKRDIIAKIAGVVIKKGTLAIYNERLCAIEVSQIFPIKRNNSEVLISVKPKDFVEIPWVKVK